MSQPRHERTEVKLLSLDLIERDPLIEPRIEPIDRHIVQAIAWSIRNGISPRPILVFSVGPRSRKRFLLVDGLNRIAATRSTGGTEIMCEIVVGTIEEATWAAAGVNGRPQQTRSPAEVRRAVAMAIRSAPEPRTSASPSIASAQRRRFATFAELSRETQSTKHRRTERPIERVSNRVRQPAAPRGPPRPNCPIGPSKTLKTT